MTDKVLQRTMFETSRVLEYFTERELSYQTGHSRDAWPQVILKELMDNALDGCENPSVNPEIKGMTTQLYAGRNNIVWLVDDAAQPPPARWTDALMPIMGIVMIRVVMWPMIKRAFR